MSTVSHTPKNLAQLVALWRRRLRKQDGHMVVVVTGPPGNGKSSLTLQLTRKIQDTPLEGNVRRHVVFRVRDGPAAARSLPRYSVIDYDEAINEGGNKRRAMSGSNVEQMTFLNTCRKMNQAQLYLYPFWDDADEPIRKHAQWVLEVYQKGRVRAYSVELVGGPKAKSIWLEPRFEDTFPDCAKAHPELWGEYKEWVDEFLYERGDPRQPRWEKAYHRFLEAARDVLLARAE